MAMLDIKSPASPFYSPRQQRTTPTTNAISNIPILVTALLAILATGGPTYSFGVYAATLKHTLQLSQSQLETLGSASFAAGFISWIPGLCVDAWGSRRALLTGGLGQSCGLALYWIVARLEILPEAVPLVPVLSCLSVLIFTCNNLVIGGVFKAIVTTCGLGTKGKAVGAAKAYLGLGAGTFSSLFRALPDAAKENDLDFLAMSSICAIVAIVVPALLGLPTSEQINKKGTKDESTISHYNLVYAGLFALAVVVVGTSAMDLFSFSQSTINFPEWLHGVIILTVWIGPILALLALPTQSTTTRKRLQKQQSALRQKVRKAMMVEEGQSNPTSNEKQRLLPPGLCSPSIGRPSSDLEKQTTFSFRDSLDSNATDNDTNVQETPQPIPDLTLLEMLQTTRAWLFLTASTILVGAGTMLTINMGQLVQAQHRPPETAAACLSLFSVAQALARVVAGATSEAALQWKHITVFGIEGVPRPAFLVLCSAFACMGSVCLAMGNDESLHWFVVGIVLTGISFGFLWPLMVLIIGDLFGTVNHGANYMFADGFTCAVGTLSIAKFLTQAVYESHVAVEEQACYGVECFRTTHWIISGLCGLSLVACTLLLYMTRSSYGSVLE